MEEDISGEKAQEILEQNSHYNNFDVMEYREEEISQDKENIQQKGCDQNFESRKNLVKNDLFDLEAAVEGRGHSTRQTPSWGTVMKLAFQCIGVVYGDLGTSPLYVLPGIFPNGIKHDDDLLGVLSLIIYSLIFISLIKYVFVVLAANDNGDGGTFALYSLICRYAKVSLIPNQQAEDRDVSNYNLDTPNRRVKRASAIKSVLENSHILKYFLFFMTMVGVSMVIGDGILTPCISVLSAVGGIKGVTNALTDTSIMWISVVILIFLFQIQRFGTDKIGYTFAPILTLWFVFIAFVGIYNIIKHDIGVIKAFNPWYIVQYFIRNKKDAWISLGGVILCLTGSEALFADLGHFNIRSIQISTCFLVLPSVLLCYLGQCSYLRKNMKDVTNAFYSSVPTPLYWPQFILAILATIIASQSLISASFSIVQQSVALRCFPRVKVVHTSAMYEGQVYVPEINTILMLACVGVTLGFKNTLEMGNAYGLAVAFVFVITSILLILVMIMIWKTHIIFIILYVLTINLIELAFVSSVLYKFVNGGYIPLLFSLIFVSIMFIWNFGYREKYMYELENKVPAERLANIVCDPRIHRVEGFGLFYTQLVQGISPVFTHYVSSVPALHSVLVFVSIKSLPISKVPAEEQFLIRRVTPQELIFQCVVRYGYKDATADQKTFEEMLVNHLKEFIQDDYRDEVQRELALFDKALSDGVVYLVGEGDMMVSQGSNLAKKVIIDYLHNWLSRCVRQPDEVYLLPRKRLLKVGMTYEV